MKALFWVLYVSLFLKRKGATAGMLIMKLRLIDLATGQTPKKTLWRAAFGLLSAVPFGLGYFRAFFEKDKRTWHDLSTGTMMVKA